MNEEEPTVAPPSLDIPTTPRNSSLPNRTENLLPPPLETASFPPLPSQPSQNPIPQTPAESNPWKKPNPIISRPRKKFYLRFIPPASRGPDQVGVCSSDAVAPEIQILDNTLVGFFLGKRPGFTYVRSALLKQWRLSGSVEVLQLLHGGIAFRFSCIADRDLIVDQGMYYVGGQPIFLRPWERNMHTGSVMGLKKIPLWVTLPGLPLHLWGEESLSAVCSVLGKPLFTDQITAARSRWAFARACVEFSGEKPLSDNVLIEDDEGNLFHQPVKYSWKPPQCLSCGTFGHGLDACKSSQAESVIPASNSSDLNDAHTDESLLERVHDGSQPSSSALEEAVMLERTRAGGLPSTPSALAKGLEAPSLLQSWKFQPRIGRLPMRVRTMRSSLTRDPSHLPGSVDCQSYGQVSNSPSSPPVLPPKPKKHAVDQKPSQQNSNFPATAQKHGPILVSVGSLDSYEIQSEPHFHSSNPGGPPCPPASSLDGKTPLDPMDPTPYSSPGSIFPEPNPLIQTLPSGISHCSPSNRDMTGPFPSSDGNTPDPLCSTLNPSCFARQQDSVNPTFSDSQPRSFPQPIRRPFQMANQHKKCNNLHALMAPICKKKFAVKSVAPAEEGAEEDKEEEEGLEEEDNEDVAEEEDAQYGTEEREENSAKRKHSSYSPNHGQSLSTPVLIHPLKGSDSSSIGRTPYPTRPSNPTNASQSKSDSVNPSSRKKFLAINDANLENMMMTIPDPWFEEGQGLPLPAPLHASADATVEDVEEEDEEEEGGIEEEDNDEDVADDDDGQYGREDEEKDAAKRNISADYGKDGDLFLKTTDVRDPRRILFSVQDNIEEAEDDLEEEENEDYTEEDDKPSERDKEEEDVEIRKRLLALVKDDDRWVTTTNQKDPRRIRIC